MKGRSLCRRKGGYKRQCYPSDPVINIIDVNLECSTAIMNTSGANKLQMGCLCQNGVHKVMKTHVCLMIIIMISTE